MPSPHSHPHLTFTLTLGVHGRPHLTLTFTLTLTSPSPHPHPCLTLTLTLGVHGHQHRPPLTRPTCGKERCVEGGLLSLTSFGVGEPLYQL